MTVKELMAALGTIEGDAEVRVLRKDEDYENERYGEIESISYQLDVLHKDSVVYLGAKD